MLKSSLITVALLATSEIAFAQPQPPSAGSQLQQIPPAQSPAAAVPDIDVGRSEASADPVGAGPTIRVNSLHVTGNTVFPEAQLIAAAAVPPGSDLTLSQLREAAARISSFYGSRGHFLAQAYLPAQDIRNGAVTINVVEGRYGTTGIRNRANLSDRVANDALSGLDAGDPVTARALERRLLLMSDIPGITVRSALSPGTLVGTSDLTVDLASGPLVTGSVESDNAGNRYTGAYRLGGTLNLNNPAGIGDRASLRLLGSTGGLAYGRAAYQAPFGNATLGLAYTHLRYQLGREFSSLNADGTADILSVFGSYPLVRSRNVNLYALLGADLRLLEDRIGLVAAESDKTSRVLTAGLSGNSHDSLAGGGWNQFAAGFTLGDLHIQNALERAADALAGRREGGFGKFQLSAARLQTVTGPLSLYAAVRGQLAFANLDTSEQMELGGAQAVRAYPEGEAYGDQGYVATVEARLTLVRWAESLPGQLQLITFLDMGEVEFARNPWFAGSNHARRSGIGTGLTWSGPDNLVARVAYARRLGDAVSTSGPDRAGRFLFQLGRLF